MAGKSIWDLANRRQKLGLVWRIRKKISQIIKDYFYLPFFLLIILWASRTPLSAATQTSCLGTSYQDASRSRTDCISLRLSPFTWLLTMCLGIQPGLSMPISSSTSSFAGLASLFPQPLRESLLYVDRPVHGRIAVHTHGLHDPHPVVSVNERHHAISSHMSSWHR